MLAVRDPYTLRIAAGAVRIALGLCMVVVLGPLHAEIRTLLPLVYAYLGSAALFLLLIVLRIGDRPRAVSGALIDMAMITMLVHVMGSHTSIFTTVYVFAAVLNTLTVGPRVGSIVAVFACLSYGGLLLGEHLGVFVVDRVGPRPASGESIASWALTTFMVLTTTLIVSSLLETKAEGERRLREANQRLLDLTNRDPLTDLWNRRYLYARITRAVEKGKLGRFGLAVFDLDGFKGVNDAYGHLGGDALLQAVARALAEHAGPHDVVCRFGGDEFVVLVRAPSAAEAAKAVDRMRRAVCVAAADFRPGCQVTASVGFTFSGPTDDAESLLRRADDNAYRAKHAGKDRLVLDESAGDKHT